MSRILLGEIILLTTLILNGLLAFKTWQRRPAPGAGSFGTMTFLVAVYAGIHMVWLVVHEAPYLEVALHILRLATTAFIPVAWMLFTLQYTGRERWTAPDRVGWLVAIPVLTVVLSFDVLWPGLLTGWEINAAGEFQYTSYGPWFYVHVLYTYFLFVAGLVVLLRRLPFSGQGVTLLFSIVATLSLELLAELGINVWGPLPSPAGLSVGLSISALAAFWGMYRYKFLDVVPLAHHVVVEGMGDALLVLDSAGRVGDLNPEATRVLGLAPAQVVGRSVEQLLPEHPELVQRCREQQEAQLEIARGLGENRRYYDASVTPLHDAKGRRAGSVLVLHDVTERKQREEELRRAWQAAEADNRAKSTFLSNVSHQLRTPLSAVIGYSEVLQSEVTAEAGAVMVPDLQRIAAAGQSLLAVLTDILDLAKAEAGRTDLYLERFSFTYLVQEVVEALAPMAARANNRLQVVAPDGLGSMYADQAKVRRILYSVLHNACKFTENGRITLGVSRQQRDGADWLRVQVADTGTGMTREQVEHLFVPFAQNRTARLKHGGAGLSMALSQHWCRAMGGEMHVESEPGLGTTVTIWLPAAVAEAAAIPAEAGTNATVLVLDDDAAVRTTVAEALRPLGYRVVGAAGGREGLQLAREVRPHAVLLDVMMPDMDGWAVLSAMRADPDLAGVPVILLANGPEAGGTWGRGTLDTLVKPLEPGRLRQAVGECRRLTAAAS